jgi:L-iduronidase
MVTELVLHLQQRYGVDEVESWMFESWNEPDGGNWWKQWPTDLTSFCNYYDACSEGVKRANPKIIFGGPGTCRTLSPLFKAAMAHCDSGKNYFTGETSVRIDFISIHEKGAAHHKEDLNPNTETLWLREADILQYIRDHHPRLGDKPFMNNECDPQVGWWDVHTWHGRPYYAAIACKIINQHLLGMIDGMNCDYVILSNDNGFIGTWGNRTLMTRFGPPMNFDDGQSRHKPHLSTGEKHVQLPFEMIKKPILNAWELLAMMGDTRVMVSGAGGTKDDIGAIAAKRDDTQVSVLVYHSRDRIMSSGSEKITLNLVGLPFEKATLVHYRIDEDHGDPYVLWEKSNVYQPPSKELLSSMRANQELQMLAPPKDIIASGGAVTIDFDMPLPSVSLILLTVPPGDAPGKIEKVWLETYEGLTGEEEILVVWKGLPQRTIKTYEVLCASSPEGPYTRVNPSDLFSTAFLHVAPAGKKYYRVRAVDFWGRISPESDIVNQ